MTQHIPDEPIIGLHISDVHHLTDILQAQWILFSGLIGGDYMAIGRLPNPHLPVLPNCMGLTKTGRCTWLNYNACMGKECKFKRSEEECRSSRIHTFQRLASLEDSRQAYIANKYYNGRKPWDKYCFSEARTENNER